jgi:hypothetical protein
MKNETKLKLAATAATLLVTGFLSQTATANVITTGTVYDATLTAQAGPEMGSSFVAESICLAPGATFNPSATEYYYYYQFGVNYAPPPVPIASASVFFATGPAGANSPGGAPAYISADEINWQFGAGLSVGDFYYLSPIAPTLGYISALDGGLWGGPSGGNAFGVVVPNVPDSGMTISLLGGALVGIGALRRKFSC